MRRKLLITAGGLLASLLIVLLLVPVLFRGRIEAAAHRAVEGALDAQVSWSGVGLTFFRNFPNLTLRLDDLVVVGNEPFAGDTLASVEGIGFVLDAGTLIRGVRGTGPVLVRSVRFDRPSLRLAVLGDGRANWDVVRDRESAAATPAPTTAGPGRAMQVELRSLSVDGGSLVLDDARTGLHAALDGVSHTLSGDFSKDRFVLRTRTRSDATTLRFAGLPYLEGVALDFQADLDADLAAGRFTFADNELRLNGLILRFDGSAARAGEDVDLDVTFEAPETGFAQILSLVPVVWTHDFDRLETSGEISVQGHVRGAWGEEAFPAFSVNAEVSDGMFRYPDLPLPARDVSLQLAVDNPGGDVDSTVVRISRLHVRVGEEPIDAALTVRTPVSDPDVDASVKGALDLADLPRTLKLEAVRELTGRVRADASVRARLSDVDAARWERVAARGGVTATDVSVAAADLPPIAVREGTLAFSPQRAELRSLDLRLGASDVQASGSLDNLLGFVFRGEDLTGRANFTSGFFDLDEWRSEDSKLRLIPVPGGLDLTLQGTVRRLKFGVLEMTDARGGLTVQDRKLTLSDFALGILGGRMGMDGFYETADPDRPTFGASLRMDSLDIPGASAAFLTVRTLAPVARFARGAFSAELQLDGALGTDMAPLFEALNGGGSVLTTPMSLDGFPAMARLSEALSLPQLSNPTLQAIRSSLEIRDGRLHVRPFQVRMGDFRLGVEGSNGVDQSLDYTLTLGVPRALLGSGADQAVRTLAAQAGRAGLDLQPGDTVEIAVGLAGTVTAPSVRTEFRSVVGGAGERVQEAAGAALTERLDAAEAQADSSAAEARRRVQAQADSIIQEAEERAAAIRAEARKLADEARAQADRRAEQVVAEAKDPVARVAARALADRLKKEADGKATALVQEADQRADQLVATARARAEELLKGG